MLDLAKNFQLDGMIVDGTIVMILDQDAVARPRSLADLAQPLVKRIQKNDVPYYDSAAVSLAAYKALYAMAPEQSGWPSPESIQQKTATEFPLSSCSEVIRRVFTTPH